MLTVHAASSPSKSGGGAGASSMGSSTMGGRSRGEPAVNAQQAMAERAYKENWGQRRFQNEMAKAGFTRKQMSQTYMMVDGIHDPSLRNSRAYRRFIGG